jgi:hypothetical protein
MLTPSNFATNAIHHSAENQNAKTTTANASDSSATTKHTTSQRKLSDWRRLASISPSRTAWPNRNTADTDTNPNANRLVYEDARRAARVLLDRLPVDLPLADFALVDR